MPARFSTLVLDLHNTIYDEVTEYGQAINEAIVAWIEAARQKGQELKPETIYKELSAAHKLLGSDWDDGAWMQMPSLARLGFDEAGFAKQVKNAEAARRNKSRQLTQTGAYEGIRETLVKAKARGVHIYVVTEASAESAMQSLYWLKLGSIVDGVYSYPSRKQPMEIAGTYQRNFPDAPNGSHLKKPHPFLLATVAFDEAIRRKAIPADTKFTDVFGVTAENTFMIPELPDTSPIQQDAGAKLVLRKTPYADALRTILDSMLFVGDSKFKDGLLARNAGVTFGYAAYGKKSHDEKALQASRDIMYAVTGWDKDVLKLTQEAARAQSVNRLKPDFTFENGISEVLPLLVSHAQGQQRY